MGHAFNAVYILWLRQLKRFFRSKPRVLGSLGQPLLFLIAFGFGFGPIFQKAGGGNYIEFLAPGIIAMAVLSSAIFSGIEIIWDRQFGFLKETMVAPVSRFWIMVGRTLGGATVAFLQGIIVFVLALIMGFQPNFSMLLVAGVFMALIAILFTAIGTALASVLEDFQGFQLIMNFLVMPLFFFSGALFPLNGLPDFLVTITALNPLTYGIDGLRASLSVMSASHFGTGFDFIVLAAVTAVFVAIGSFLFSKTQI